MYKLVYKLRFLAAVLVILSSVVSRANATAFISAPAQLYNFKYNFKKLLKKYPQLLNSSIVKGWAVYLDYSVHSAPADLTKVARRHEQLSLSGKYRPVSNSKEFAKLLSAYNKVLKVKKQAKKQVYLKNRKLTVEQDAYAFSHAPPDIQVSIKQDIHDQWACIPEYKHTELVYRPDKQQPIFHRYLCYKKT